MKLLWTTLHVKNLEESLNFYQEIVGLKIDKRFSAGPMTEIVFLGDGETKLELVYGKNAADVNFGSDISIGFPAESLDEKMELIKSKGIEIAGDIMQPNPSTRFFFIKDPNGLTVQFVEQK